MTATGETTASINGRADDKAWPATRCALLRGAELRQPVGLKNWYAYFKSDPVSGTGLTPGAVKRRERACDLQRVGEVYKIVEPRVKA